MFGENLETNKIRSSQINKKPNRCGSIPYTGNLHDEIYIVYITGNLCTRVKGTPQSEEIQKPSAFLPGDATPTGPRNRN